MGGGFGLLLLALGPSCAPAATPGAVPRNRDESGARHAPGGSRFVYVAGYDPTISIFRFEPEHDLLARVGEATSGRAPSYLAIAPDKAHLYALDETDRSEVAAFSIDAGSGALTPINRVPTGGAGAAHLAIDPSGRWVVAAHYDSGQVTVHALRADGGIGEKTEDIHPGTNAHQVVFDRSGRFVFVPCLGSNVVAQLRFAGGKLAPNDPPAVAVGGGPRHMVFDAKESHAYVLSELENTVTTFDYDRERGSLSHPRVLSSLAAGGKKTAAAHLAISENGRFLYASNREDDSIAIFSVDAMSGNLANVGWQRVGADYVRDFALDGGHLLAANQNAGTLALFRVDDATGGLTLAGTPVRVPPKPAFVGVISLPR
jgi:6-phosphogluconolactonase